MRLRLLTGTVALGAITCSPLVALQTDSADVARTVATFHHALAAGDSAAALGLLAPDVIVLESGNAQTRDEYRSGHLGADMAFARAVPRERSAITVQVEGRTAWAWSTALAQGTYREREINSRSAELMVLRRTEAGWRIVAIHWSSRALRQ